MRTFILLIVIELYINNNKAFVVRKYAREYCSKREIGSCIKYRDMKHFDEEQYSNEHSINTAFVFDDIDNVVYVHISSSSSSSSLLLMYSMLTMQLGVWFL